jgi:hypothetical protein
MFYPLRRGKDLGVEEWNRSRGGAFSLNDPNGRRLIWIPIIHAPEDLGKLRNSVRDRHIGHQGTLGWDAYVRGVGEFWREVRRKVERLDVDPSKLRLYQDALPICGFEEKIVRELAQAGGANHRLLADLMAKGASLIGTESPHLLVEEYELNRKALAGEVVDDLQEKSRALLQARDRFIAERIDRTLPPGSTGLIFLGMAHSLESVLPADIAVDRIDLASSAR